MNDPLRGEIWTCDFEPTRGHEQGMRRPALVVSTDRFNQGPAELAIVIPITGTDRGIPTHVPIKPPEGGIKKASFVMSDQIRCVAKERLSKKWGTVSPETMAKVKACLRILLEI